MDGKKTEEKMRYEAPYVEVRRFSVRDIVRTSPIVMPKDPFDDPEDDE